MKRLKVSILDHPFWMTLVEIRGLFKANHFNKPYLVYFIMRVQKVNIVI
jgi:hypothetical protein